MMKWWKKKNTFLEFQVSDQGSVGIFSLIHFYSWVDRQRFILNNVGAMFFNALLDYCKHFVFVSGKSNKIMYHGLI